MKKPLLILLIVASIFTNINSQEMALNNPVMDVLSVNPAFAGSKNIVRTSINNQMKWYSAIHNTIYNSASVDLSIEKFGVGFQGEYNKLSDGFTNSNAGVSISYKIGNLRKIIIIPAVKFSFRGYYLNTNNLVFYDQLSVYEGIVSSSSATIPNQNIFVADATIGLLTQFPIDFHRTHPTWVNFGFAYDHLPKVKYTFTSDPNAYYPAKTTLHGGIYIPFYQKNTTTKQRDNMGFMLYPNFKFQNQESFSLINFGALAYKNKFVFGIAGQTFKHYKLLNKNQLVASIGYEFMLGNFMALQAMYNFDMGISTGNNPSFITHEFGISIFFVNKRSTDCQDGLKYNKKRWFNSNNIQQRHTGECPPGSTPIRFNTDVAPFFYPIELPKAYIGLQD
ncbi:MAG: hypothetical protein JXR68_04710 [Bacteroidales bacterium]|nr:hypothetical protein [Bacteroidales bacterium]